MTGSSSVHALLAAADVVHRIVNHVPTYRARDEAEAVGLPPGRATKTLVTTEGGTIRLAVIPASRRLDLRRMREATGASRRLRLATVKELATAFPEFELGTVPPLGRLVGVEEVVDPLVFEQSEVLTTAGDHTHGVLVDPTRLVDAAGARVADICQRWDDNRRHRFRDMSLG